MTDAISILIVEDVATDAELIQRWVARIVPKCRFLCVETREDFLRALSDFVPDIIYSDYRLPQFDGIAALKLTLELSPDTPFIIVTGSMSEETAVDCMKAGACDYVIKEHLQRLEAATLLALERRRLRQAQREAEAALDEGDRRFRRLFDVAAVPLCFVNRDGQIVDINRKFVQAFGYHQSDIPTLLEWWRLVYPDPEYRHWAVAAWKDGVARSVRENTDIEPIEYRIACWNGDVRTVVMSGTPLGDEYLATFVDVTECKRTESKMAEQLDELRRWQDVMLDREDRVQELKAEVNDLCRRLRETLRYPSQSEIGKLR